MIDIYIRYFKQGNNTINDWTKIESIPASSPSQLHFVNPKVKNEMGKSETMDFTVEPNSEYWSSFIPYKTFLRVVLDGYNIFYGRVLTITTTMFGSRSVQCEGPLSFLIDSYYPASKEGSRSKISVYTYLDKVLDNHNYYVAAWNYTHQNWSDPRGVYIGEVPGNYSNSISEDQKVVTEDQKYGVSSWTESKSAVEELRSYFGGYMRTRYNESDGYVYLDWFNNYFYKSNTPEEIEVTKNLIDASSTSEVNNVFTAIIPIGKNETYIDGYSTDGYLGTVTCNGKWLSAPMVYDYYGEEELSGTYRRPIDFRDGITKYGWIYKTVSFPNASTKKDLFEQACRWFKNNYQPYVENYTVKALDMRIIGGTGRPLLCGDIVRFDYSVDPVADEQSAKKALYTIISAEYDLYNPENNQYRIGIPANTLTKLYSVSGSGNSATGSGGYSPLDDTEPTVTGTYSDWIGDLYGFLSTSEVPGYPGRTYVETYMFGMVMRMYNPLTDTWETFTEQTYDTIRSKNLVSWIVQNDKVNGTNWKSRLLGNSRDETSAWTDYTKEYLSTHNAPDGKPIYDTSDNTMWNDNAKMRVPVSGEYTPALMESFGLIAYVNDTYKEDFTNVEVKREIVPGENKVDSETGKTITVSDFFKTVWNGLTGKWETFKDGWMEMVDGVAKLFDKDGNEIDLGIGDTTISSLQTEWVNHDNRIGQVVTKDGKIEVGKIVLAINEDETVDAIIHADHVKATGTGGAMFGIVTAEGTENETLSAGLIVQKLEDDEGNQATLAQLIGDKIEITGSQVVSITAQDAIKLGLLTTGKNGQSDLTAGLIVTTLQNGSSTGNKETLASLIADYLELKGTQITIDATDAARFGLVTTGVEGSTTELTAGLIVQKIQGDTGEQSTLAELLADKINITGSQITINATEAASLGILTKDNAGNTITAKFITDAINGGTATIDAKNLNLSSTEVINLINATGSVTINASKVNLNGYLQTAQLATEFGKIASISTHHITSDGTVTAAMLRATDFKYGNDNSLLDAYISASVVQTGSNVTITLGRAGGRQDPTELSFNKAATIRGIWSSGIYTVTPTAGYVNELSTSVTVVQGQGHWGDTGQGESANTYYGKIQYVIDGSEVYQDTGKSFTIDAKDRYDAGVAYATASISGNWASGVFTVAPTKGISNTVKTSLSIINGHWGDPNTVAGESVNRYYFKIGATINDGSTVYETGKSDYIDASGRYNAGWSGAYAEIGISHADATLANGGSVTIYPTGKPTPSSSSQYVTTKGITISSLTYSLDPSSNPAALNPGGSQVVKLMSQNGSDTPVEVSSITVSARVIQAADITADSFEKISATGGYSNIGTATPESSDTYWGFRISDIKNFYIKVNAAASPVVSVSGNWASGVFTVTRDSDSTSVLTTSLTIINGHWGNPTITAGEGYNKYYFDIGATINGGSTVVNTGKSSYVDAAARYNQGYLDSYQAIGISHADATLANGGSVTIYPTGKQSYNAESQYVTGKSCTISSLAYSLDPSTNPSALNPGESTVVKLMSKRGSEEAQEVASITVSARVIQAADITADSFEKISATGGYSNVGTATPETSDTYWGFRISDLKNFYIKVNKYTIPAQTITISGWSTASANDGISEIGTCALGNSVSGYWKFTVNGTNTYRVKATVNSNGWYNYYHSSSWAKATSSSSWYATIPNEDGSGSETWDCGARAAYDSGAGTCYIGNENYVKRSGNISLTYGESVTLWPYGTKLDGGHPWGDSVTITAPGSSLTFSCTNTARNQTSYSSGALNCGGVTLANLSQRTYIVFTISVSGTSKQCYIPLN